MRMERTITSFLTATTLVIGVTICGEINFGGAPNAVTSCLAAPAKTGKPAPGKPKADGVTEEAYMKALQAKIAKFWHPPDVKEGGKVTVEIQMNGKGEVSNVEITEPHSDQAINDLAVNAVKQAAPFGTLPAQFKDGLNLTYNFQLRPNIDVDPYMDRLSGKVNSVWQPPVVARSAKVVLHFTVNKNGTIKDLSVKQASGIKLLDDLSQAAIKKAAPFGELPAGVDALPVDFTLAAGPKGASVERYRWNGVPLPKAGWQVSRGGAKLQPLEIDEKIDNNLKAREWKIKDRIDKLTVAVSSETDKAKKARMLHELGTLHKDIQSHDKASAHLEQAATLESEINPDGAGLGKVLSAQAEVAALAGNTEKSAELYEKALEILRKNPGTAGNTNEVLAKTIQEYARVLYKLNKVDKANELYAELKTLQASGGR